MFRRSFVSKQQIYCSFLPMGGESREKSSHFLWMPWLYGAIANAFVPVLQWNNHPHFLVYVPSKWKVTQNIFNLPRMAPKCTITYFHTSKYYHGDEKLKTCQEQPHLLSGRFIKVFHKMTTTFEWCQEWSSYTGLSVNCITFL